MIAILILLWSNPTSMVLSTPDPYIACSFKTLSSDGSILINSNTSLYRYSEDGRLLQTIGKRGYGPGEFISIGSVFWDGCRFFIGDSTRGDTSIFDGEGNFLIRRYYAWTEISRAFGKYILLDLEPLLSKHPSNALYWAQFDHKFSIIKKSGFQPYQQIVFDYLGNYRTHFLTEVNSELFVAHQLAPQIFVYNQDLELIRTVNITLDGYAKPPRRKGVVPGAKAFAISDTISILYNLFYSDKYFIICFYGPIPGKRTPGERPKIIPTYLQVVDLNGSPVSQVVATKGPCLGVFKKRFLFADKFYGNELTLHWESATHWLPPGTEGYSHEK